MAFQGDSIFWVEVEKIVPNPFQPRREFDEDKLKELAESVRMYGILQPLTVTRREIQNEDGSFRSEYELIAGERRLRASKLAGVAQVPVIIREGEQSEQEKLELAIIENLQREDLNAVDRAIAFRQLADVFGLSHMQVAKKMGRSREYVSNSIRILALPDYMLTAVRTGDLSEGHARALLMLNDRPEEQDTVFRETLFKKLSVRDVERIARGIATEKMRKKNDYDADLLALEKQFTETLGTRVSITKTDFGGRLSIDYFTQVELEEILEGMRREGKKLVNLSPQEINTTESEAPNYQLGQPIVQALGNPRDDALAILSQATGLELVPDTSYTFTPVVTEFVSATPPPIVMIPVPEVEELPVGAEVTMDGAVGELEMSQYVQTAVTDVSEAYVPPFNTVEPSVVIDEFVMASAKPIETAVDVPIVEIVETQPEEVKIEAVAPEPTPILSLRDQLALRLKKNVTPPATTAPVTPVAVVEKVIDDSDLYSIRDFSV